MTWTLASLSVLGVVMLPQGRAMRVSGSCRRARKRSPACSRRNPAASRAMANAVAALPGPAAGTTKNPLGDLARAL
jgi:hypothetical protein